MPIAASTGPSADQLSLKLPVPENGPLYLPPDAPPLDDEALGALCAANPDLSIERTAEGGLIVMAPAYSRSGFQSGEVFGQLRSWALRDGTGVAFDSSAGFRLPGGRAMRAPDACWVRRSRLAALSEKARAGFLPLCPDFLIEVGSPSDRLADLQKKMREYRAAGLRLGWLIHPGDRGVEIWTPEETKMLANPATITAGPPVAGFILDLAAIWEPPF